MLVGRSLGRQPGKWHVINYAGVGLRRSELCELFTINLARSVCGNLLLRLSRPKGVNTIKSVAGSMVRLAEAEWRITAENICATCVGLHGSIHNDVLDSLDATLTPYGLTRESRNRDG